jgi:hypothetical protein
MAKILIDLTENEDKPIIRELITKHLCYYRYMNDVSKGALLIKEKHRLRKEKEVVNYTLEKLRLQRLITTSSDNIVI